MVNWVIDSPHLSGGQPITDISTTARHPLGTIAQAHDQDGTYGGGEFIYLRGVASTITGSWVNYDDTFQTALDTSATAGPPRPLGVAMGAIVASRFGWYQISGMAIAAKSNAVSFADGASLGAGSGLTVAAATGSIINGAIVSAVASAKSNVTTVLVCINRPHDPIDVS